MLQRGGAETRRMPEIFGFKRSRVVAGNSEGTVKDQERTVRKIGDRVRSQRRMPRYFRAWFLVAACGMVLGCRDVATIWSAEARSPDGNWTARARTDQYGGPGTAFVGTSVYLYWINGSKPPVLILGLSNESAYPNGITSVKMNWLTPSKLELAYQGHASIDFEAIKCAGIDISVRDLSSAAPRIPQ